MLPQRLDFRFRTSSLPKTVPCSKGRRSVCCVPNNAAIYRIEKESIHRHHHHQHHHHHHHHHQHHQHHQNNFKKLNGTNAPNETQTWLPVRRILSLLEGISILPHKCSQALTDNKAVMKKKRRRHRTPAIYCTYVKNNREH